MSKKRIICYFLLILLLITIDQASKSFLIYYLKTKPSYFLELLPVLDFVYAWNYGISFGLFREYYQYSNNIFLITNSLIIIYFFYLLITAKNYFVQIGVVLIIGGAIGNLIDRIFRGAVFDFIYFHYAGFSFPAFNMADCFITVGACFFLCNFLFLNKKTYKKNS